MNFIIFLMNNPWLLIETITESSVNTINSGFEIEDLITERLLNNARLIRDLDAKGNLTRQEAY